MKLSLPIAWAARMRSSTRISLFLAALTLYGVSAYAGPVTAPNLGTAIDYGLLAGTVSNTGTSQIQGNVGAMTSITGFPPGTAAGSVALAGPVVTAAFDAFSTALNFGISDVDTPATQTVAGGLAASQDFIGNNVYSFSAGTLTSAAGITLTFDAQGNSSEVFILKDIGSMTINGPVTFNLIDGAQASNIYWIIGSSATINPTGVPLTWDGSILAGSSFTMSASTGGSGVLAGTINGCVYAESGTATLAGETDVTGCSASAVSSAPEPATVWLFAIGCLACVFFRSRFHVSCPKQCPAETRPDPVISDRISLRLTGNRWQRPL